MDDGSGTARCGDNGQRPGRGAQRRTVQRTAGTDRDGEHGQKTKSEGEEKVSCSKGCVKEKGNKNTAWARSAPTYTKSRRPARRLSHLAEHQRTTQTLLHAHRSSSYPQPHAQSPVQGFHHPRAQSALRNLPFDPSSFPSAESGSRPYLSRAATPRCCVRPTLSAVEWPVIIPP